MDHRQGPTAPVLEFQEEQSVYFPGLPRARCLRKLAAVWMIQNCGFVTNKIHDLPDTAFRSNDKQKSRRDAARLVFRRLVRDSLLAGLPESIYRADPHVESLITQAQKHIRSRSCFCSGAMRAGSPQRCATHIPPECSQAKPACKPRVRVPWINRPDIDGPRATHANALDHVAHNIPCCAHAKHLLKCFGNPWILI